MSTNLTPEQILQNTIALGRAYVRMVETADALLERQPFWTEWLLLRLVRTLYSRRLREVVRVMLSEITNEILAASDKMTGPIVDTMRARAGISSLRRKR